MMTRLQKIQEDIADLGPKDLAALAEWLDDHRQRLWDKEIEGDLRAGKLDLMIDEARAEISAGRTKPL